MRAVVDVVVVVDALVATGDTRLVKVSSRSSHSQKNLCGVDEVVSGRYVVCSTPQYSIFDVAGRYRRSTSIRLLIETKYMTRGWWQRRKQARVG